MKRSRTGREMRQVQRKERAQQLHMTHRFGFLNPWSFLPQEMEQLILHFVIYIFQPRHLQDVPNVLKGAGVVSKYWRSLLVDLLRVEFESLKLCGQAVFKPPYNLCELHAYTEKVTAFHAGSGVAPPLYLELFPLEAIKNLGTVPWQRVLYMSGNSEDMIDFILTARYKSDPVTTFVDGFFYLPNRNARRIFWGCFVEDVLKEIDRHNVHWFHALAYYSTEGRDLPVFKYVRGATATERFYRLYPSFEHYISIISSSATAPSFTWTEIFLAPEEVDDLDDYYDVVYFHFRFHARLRPIELLKALDPINRANRAVDQMLVSVQDLLVRVEKLL